MKNHTFIFQLFFYYGCLNKSIFQLVRNQCFSSSLHSVAVWITGPLYFYTGGWARVRVSLSSKRLSSEVFIRRRVLMCRSRARHTQIHTDSRCTCVWARMVARICSHVKLHSQTLLHARMCVCVCARVRVSLSSTVWTWVLMKHSIDTHDDYKGYRNRC